MATKKKQTMLFRKKTIFVLCKNMKCLHYKFYKLVYDASVTLQKIQKIQKKQKKNT